MAKENTEPQLDPDNDTSQNRWGVSKPGMVLRYEQEERDYMKKALARMKEMEDEKQSRMPTAGRPPAVPNLPEVIIIDP